MFKASKYRIYPTASQKELIAKHIGCCRFVYNLALETKISAYKGSKHNFSIFDLQKQLPDLKKECPWLKEVNSQSLAEAIHNMDTAFKQFFRGKGFPKFKSKNNKQTFPILQSISIKNGRLVIPKFKEGIEIVLHRPIIGIIKRGVISVTPTGKYFISILVDTKTEAPTKAVINEDTTVGVDLGIKDFAVTSDGEVIESPKFLRKALSKIKYLDRKYSKYKGKRTKQKRALAYEKVTNQRKDFLHKASTKLIRENQTICLEDLNVKGMMNNHCLALSIGDVGWGMFADMLKYKAEWYGNNILHIGRFEPSSKTCSCGVVNKDLKLSDRTWTCGSCGTTHDRDFLAANNIKSFALKNISVGRRVKNQNELPTLVGVLTSEAFG